jgi:preprotein translocase subunit SecG
MDSTTLIRIIAGAVAVVILVILIQRRRTRVK